MVDYIMLKSNKCFFYNCNTEVYKVDLKNEKSSQD